MIVFIIGIILRLTAVIVMLCVRIRLSHAAHQGRSHELKSTIATLRGQNALHQETLRLSDELQVSMEAARRELDRQLIEAASGKAT